VRWLNSLANLAILGWICTWVAEPGMLALDLAGLAGWIGITCIETHRDFWASR